MLDILRIDPSEAYAVDELTRCLRARLKPTEVDNLLVVLYCWERTLTGADLRAIAPALFDPVKPAPAAPAGGDAFANAERTFRAMPLGGRAVAGLASRLQPPRGAL